MLKVKIRADPNLDANASRKPDIWIYIIFIK